LNYNTPAKGLSCRSGGNLIYIVISMLVWALLVSAAWLTDQPVAYNPDRGTGKSDSIGSIETQGLSITVTPASLESRANHITSLSASLRPDRNTPVPNRQNSSSPDCPSSDPMSPGQSSSGSNRPFFTQPKITISAECFPGRRCESLQPSSLRYVIAMVLRGLGKILAIVNTFWVVTHNFLEFLSKLDNCWCTTSMALKGLKGVRHVWLWDGLNELRGYDNVEVTWQLITTWTCVVCVAIMGLIWGVCRASRK